MYASTPTPRPFFVVLHYQSLCRDDLSGYGLLRSLSFHDEVGYEKLGVTPMMSEERCLVEVFIATCGLPHSPYIRHHGAITVVSDVVHMRIRISGLSILIIHSRDS